MSINEEEVPEGKKEVLLNEQEQISKKKILLYYGLTVGSVLLIIIIVFLLAVHFGGSPKNKKKNSLLLKYIANNNNTLIKLFNPILNDSISYMKIDGKKIKTIYEYNFTYPGEHVVEVYLKEELSSMKSLFENCQNLKEINLSTLETKNSSSMEEMFSGCTNLISVDLSNLNTSKILNLKKMFYGCTSLESVNLTNFDASKVEDMDMMFYSCNNLKNLIFTNFKTLNVKNMTGMFYHCNSLKNLDLSNFITINVTSMKMMFDSCYSLKNINLENFDTSKVTDMSNMFASLTNIESLDLNKFATANVQNMNKMFFESISLKTINLDSFNTSNVEEMSLMFYNCKSITSLNLGNFKTDKVKNIEGIFSGCESLKYLNIENLNARKSKGKNLFNDVPKDGEIHFNSKLFDLLLIKDTNIENWKQYNNRRNPEDMTTMEVTKDMSIGINLGNTLEAYGDWIWQWGDHTITSYETAWGSPKLTKEMIWGIKSEGFEVLRLPVHWFNMMSEDYTINQDLLERVKQIVDWAIEIELYVILNIHHDERDLFRNMTVTPEENLEKYKYIWEQIADNFKDYNYFLMFESLNEEACWGNVYNEWSGTNEGKDIVFDLTNKINQLFVDVIRKSGGNNEKRHLLIAGYCTGVEHTCDSMYKMPDDPSKRCAVSIHYYNPSTFCIISEDADWGKAQSTWGTEAEIKDLNDKFDLMKTTLIDNGIPVIIGEYGSTRENKDINSVRKFLYSICKAAYDRDILPILWDTPGGWYDRENTKFNDTILADMLKSVKN